MQLVITRTGKWSQLPRAYKFIVSVNLGSGLYQVIYSHLHATGGKALEP